MELVDNRQVYNILHNLTSLEISFMEYSRFPKDYNSYQTYMEYFNNYIIKNQNLFRFYFPVALNSVKLPKRITEIGDITDHLNIMPGYSFSVAKQFNFPNPLRHKCNYYSLIYFMKGHGILHLDDQSFHLNTGDFYLIPSGIYYALETSLESICIFMNLRNSFVASEYKNIFMDEPQITNFITKSLAVEHTMTYLALHTKENEAVPTLVLTIFTEYINQDKYSNNIMKNYLSLLFATILRDKNTTIDSSVKITRHDQQYQQIINYLKQNYQAASLTDLADHIHFSKQYICKIVKEKTGDTFNTLLMKTRLDMAAQYLLDTSLTLEDISYLCGFTASSHFSRLFKNHYGISPSVFRKEKSKK